MGEHAEGEKPASESRWPWCPVCERLRNFCRGLFILLGLLTAGILTVALAPPPPPHEVTLLCESRAPCDLLSEAVAHLNRRERSQFRLIPNHDPVTELKPARVIEEGCGGPCDAAVITIDQMPTLGDYVALLPLGRSNASWVAKGSAPLSIEDLGKHPMALLPLSPGRYIGHKLIEQSGVASPPGGFQLVDTLAEARRFSDPENSGVVIVPSDMSGLQSVVDQRPVELTYVLCANRARLGVNWPLLFDLVSKWRTLTSAIKATDFLTFDDKGIEQFVESLDSSDYRESLVFEEAKAFSRADGMDVANESLRRAVDPSLARVVYGIRQPRVCKLYSTGSPATWVPELHFETGQSDAQDEQFNEFVRDLIHYIGDKKNKWLCIEGYASDNGISAQDIDLSRDRALKTRARLLLQKELKGLIEIVEPPLAGGPIPGGDKKFNQKVVVYLAE